MKSNRNKKLLEAMETKSISKRKEKQRNDDSFVHKILDLLNNKKKREKNEQ
jgi:hypothetical protein